MEPVITTQKANCRNCYKCIRACPLKAIAFAEDQARVVAEDCILCGQCVRVCPQGAPQPVSDLPAVQRMLAAGLKVYASVAPSYQAAFPGVSFAQLSAALKKLGFTGAEETAIGATQVSKEYARLMAQGQMENIITTCCPAVVGLVKRYYPELTPQLAPVVSPAVAHARMMKSMFGSRIKAVFIGPCIAKYQEAREGNAINAVLRLDELRDWLEEEGIPLDQADPQPAEMHNTISRLYPSPGGIIATVPAQKRRGYKSYAADGVERCMEVLDSIRQGQLKGYFLEMSACEGSCVHGPGVPGRTPLLVMKERLLAAARRKTETPPPLTEQVEVELKTQHRPARRRAAQPTEEEIAAVLARTGKTVPEDRLNCGACGYPTCRDKAIAVLQGKADVEMCLPYMREKAESTSNLMMEYAPNAILLLSPEGKLVEYNTMARAMLGIRGRAGCGRDVGQYLAGGLPDLTQGAVLDVPCQLAENDKQVRLSAVATPAGDVIVVLRDVTQEEQNRTQFERARAQTLQMAQQAVDRQMRMVQQVAQLLGETTGETKAALLRMERSIAQEEGR